MHDEATTAGAGRAAALSAGALARAVTETETHVAAHGWDQPVRVFALVRTAEALEADPDVADLLDAATVEEARSNPELLMVVEQEGLPPAAVSVERLVLPPAAQEEAEAITDAAQRLAFLQERPDREDIRMVVGVLRGGQSWCVLRSRSHDDDASLYQGERLVPGLVEALEATFL